MNSERNKMTIKDIHRGTDFYTRRYRYRPRGRTSTSVSAIKPCGCEGPYMGTIVIVDITKHQSSPNAPKNWNPENQGYELRMEAKNRIGLYLNGERLFGRRWFGGNNNDLQRTLRRLAWSHYNDHQRSANAPDKADGHLHLTIEDALKRVPRGSHNNLWALMPENHNGSYELRKKPVGYVFGEQPAARALRDWHAAKNANRNANRARKR